MPECFGFICKWFVYTEYSDHYTEEQYEDIRHELWVMYYAWKKTNTEFTTLPWVL